MRAAPLVTVNIRNLAVGGAGVGEVVAQDDGGDELLGITAFVPFTATGEVVTARMLEKKERYLKAELTGIDTPSPDRVAAECKHYTHCGGCELQHISYQGQLKAKYEMISGALKAGKLPSSVIEAVRPVFPGQPYGYRRRVTLHIDATGKVGFYRQGSRTVVPIEECPISVSAIQQVLPNVQDLGRTIKGRVSSLLLEEDAKGLVTVLKAPYALSKNESEAILEAAREHFDNVTLIGGETEVGGFGRQILELPLNDKGTFTMRVPAGSFSQVNRDVNVRLIERVVDAAQVTFGQTLFDLYAGAGNFTLPLARAGASVLAVECDKRLASFGRENANRHNLSKKVEYVESSVEKFLEKRTPHSSADVILADPPRSGLGKLVGDLQFSKRFLLISCHLPSFVRDVKAFVDLGWRVESVEAFDMFAQTSYVETLGVLSRTP